MAAYQFLASIIALQICYTVMAIERGCPTGTSNYQYANAPLPLPYDAYLPATDNTTVMIQHSRNTWAAVNGTNAILARYPSLQTRPLAEIIKMIGTRRFSKVNKLAQNDSIALKNNATAIYNHGLYWRSMTLVNTSTPAQLSTELAALINSTWGSPNGMLTALSTAANNYFGSGWAWVILRGNGKLAISTTEEEDNPLMRKYVKGEKRGTPLLALDLWEHAYYLRFRNFRTNYVANFVRMLNWANLQRNYDLAVKGKIDSLWC